MDKEAVTICRNKIEEIRCNQVFAAVDKEKELKERQFIHDRRQYLAKLETVINKRKEFQLDSRRTLELELYLKSSKLGKAEADSNLQIKRRQFRKANSKENQVKNILTASRGNAGA